MMGAVWLIGCSRVQGRHAVDIDAVLHGHGHGSSLIEM